MFVLLSELFSFFFLFLSDDIRLMTNLYKPQQSRLNGHQPEKIGRFLRRYFVVVFVRKYDAMDTNTRSLKRHLLK